MAFKGDAGAFVSCRSGWMGPSNRRKASHSTHETGCQRLENTYHRLPVLINPGDESRKALLSFTNTGRCLRSHDRLGPDHVGYPMIDSCLVEGR